MYKLDIITAAMEKRSADKSEGNSEKDNNKKWPKMTNLRLLKALNILAQKECRKGLRSFLSPQRSKEGKKEESIQSAAWKASRR